MSEPGQIVVRPALPRDVPAIRDLVATYAAKRILLAKELVGYFESVQSFLVAEAPGEGVVGCGALHVMWSDLAEVRTLAVDESWLGRGVGRALLNGLLDRARELELRKIFCLTFEVEYFQAHGFEVIEHVPVTPEVYAQLVRSHDDGVAEFLELAHVKPNTLGNTRMLLTLPAAD